MSNLPSKYMTWLKNGYFMTCHEKVLILLSASAQIAALSMHHCPLSIDWIYNYQLLYMRSQKWPNKKTFCTSKDDIHGKDCSLWNAEVKYMYLYDYIYDNTEYNILCIACWLRWHCLSIKVPLNKLTIYYSIGDW